MNSMTSSGPSLPIFFGGKMSSVEIAKLTEKRHDLVMRDIRNLIEKGAISLLRFEESTYRNERGKEYPMYILDFIATMTLITGYDEKRRAIVIERWVEVEMGTALPAFAKANGKRLIDVDEYIELLEDRKLLLERQLDPPNGDVKPREIRRFKQAILEGMGTGRVAQKYMRSASTVRKYTVEERKQMRDPGASRQLSLFGKKGGE